jgi:hypothetical protein
MNVCYDFSFLLNTTKSLPKRLAITSTREQLADAFFTATMLTSFSRDLMMVLMAISVRERIEFNIIGASVESAPVP